jgi:hypothetical protein
MLFCAICRVPPPMRLPGSGAAAPPPLLPPKLFSTVKLPGIPGGAAPPPIPGLKVPTPAVPPLPIPTGGALTSKYPMPPVPTAHAAPSLPVSKTSGFSNEALFQTNISHVQIAPAPQPSQATPPAAPAPLASILVFSDDLESMVSQTLSTQISF